MEDPPPPVLRGPHHSAGPKTHSCLFVRHQSALKERCTFRSQQPMGPERGLISSFLLPQEGGQFLVSLALSPTQGVIIFFWKRVLAADSLELCLPYTSLQPPLLPTLPIWLPTQDLLFAVAFGHMYVFLRSSDSRLPRVVGKLSRSM